MALSNFKHFKSFKSVSFNNVILNISRIRSRTLTCTPAFSKKIDDSIDLDVDKPIEYLKSNAAQWQAHVSRSGNEDSAPWFQPYVISISLAVFMVYFFILREESDVDLEFNKNLYDRISGLEEKQLEIVLDYNKTHNISYADIETRLREIRSEQNTK